jgi:protein TonB
VNAEVTLAEPPPLDKNTPPPPPPPELPPPPKKATIAFVKPVVKKDEKVIEEAPPPDVEDLKDIEISTKTQEGSDDGVPEGLEDVVEEAPPAVVEEVVEKPQEVFKVVEQMPQFPDGEAALFKFINDNIKYPAVARENGIEGKVFVKFIVEADGSVTNVEVVRDIGGGCGEEAMRVVKKFPKWNPGKQRGRPVRVFFNLPVQFRLQ